MPSMINDDSAAQNREATLEESRMDSESEFVKLPIKPHFYFNIMNSIYHSIAIDPDRAEVIILQFSEMMQFYIYECSKERVQLESEIRNIHNYIGLQNMRLESEPGISLKVGGDLQNFSIAPFILIGFIENAYQHSLSKQQKDSFLDIQLFVNNNNIQFRTVNSKSASITNNNSKNGTGFLKVKKRLDALYPSCHELIINDSPDQYAVSLIIQLDK